MCFPWNLRNGRFEIRTVIWSLRDHFKSFGFSESLHLVKLTKTHARSGFQSSSQGFLSNGSHFPLPARTFYLQCLSLYLYFLTPIFIATGIISTSFYFDLGLTYFSSLCLHFPSYNSLLPQFFHSISPQRPLLTHSSTLGLLLSTRMFALLLESVSFHLTFREAWLVAFIAHKLFTCLSICLFTSFPRWCTPSEQELYIHSCLPSV